MSDSIEVRVSEKEWLYLQKDGLLPLEHVEDIRDALSLNLAQRGFDAAYVPTEEGRMLEDLLDRFLVL